MLCYKRNEKVIKEVTHVFFARLFPAMSKNLFFGLHEWTPYFLMQSKDTRRTLSSKAEHHILLGSK